MMILTRLLGIALAAYLAVLGLLFVRQRELVFPRNPARADLAAAGLPAAEELTLTAADGERLVAWTVPPRSGKPVILYFHGNAGHLGSPGRVARFRALTEDGTGCSPSVIAAMAARPAGPAKPGCISMPAPPMVRRSSASARLSSSAMANRWERASC